MVSSTFELDPLGNGRQEKINQGYSTDERAGADEAVGDGAASGKSSGQDPVGAMSQCVAPSSKTTDSSHGLRRVRVEDASKAAVQGPSGGRRQAMPAQGGGHPTQVQ